jgi:preprotein translocase subunit SecA
MINKISQLTGRVEEKRRWSEGIHQAVEAKECLKIQVYMEVLKSFYFVEDTSLIFII